jgi:hypothetical protein
MLVLTAPRGSPVPPALRVGTAAWRAGPLASGGSPAVAVVLPETRPAGAPEDREPARTAFLRAIAGRGNSVSRTCAAIRPATRSATPACRRTQVSPTASAVSSARAPPTEWTAPRRTSAPAATTAPATALVRVEHTRAVAFVRRRRVHRVAPRRPRRPCAMAAVIASPGAHRVAGTTPASRAPRRAERLAACLQIVPRAITATASHARQRRPQARSAARIQSARAECAGADAAISGRTARVPNRAPRTASGTRDSTPTLRTGPSFPVTDRSPGETPTRRRAPTRARYTSRVRKPRQARGSRNASRSRLHSPHSPPPTTGPFARRGQSVVTSSPSPLPTAPARAPFSQPGCCG